MGRPKTRTHLNTNNGVESMHSVLLKFMMELYLDGFSNGGPFGIHDWLIELSRAKNIIWRIDYTTPMAWLTTAWLIY